ncbi:MAG: carboxymuconolactone decarboxylase family protein [Chloroflexota bacterium]|nr:carboxymuconolactone decarboxylase family protein [Chloroflexota bacterium]
MARWTPRIVTVCDTVVGMARLEYPEIDSPEAQQMAEEIRRQRGGRLLHLFHMQLYNPAIADAWLRLGTAVRFKSELDDPTRELAICLVATLTQARYEYQAHRRIAIELGFTEAQLDGLHEWKTADWPDDKQRAVLALAEELTRNIAVDEAVFEAARSHLSARETVELVTTIAYYNMVARFLVGLEIDLETA